MNPRFARLKAMRGPRGLIGVRTIRPRTGADRVHRQLATSAFPQLPRPAAYLFQLLLLFRWVGWEAWRESWKVWKRGEDRQHRQLGRLASRAVLHGLSPRELVAFDVVDAPIDDALAFIYSSETGAYHRMRSLAHGDPAAGERLLSDKVAFETRLREAGFPTVPTLRTWGAGETIDELPDSAGDVVVKPVTANQARGYLRVDTEHRTAKNLLGKEIEMPFDELLERGVGQPRLAQPFVDAHPDLRDLGSVGELSIVLRVITERTPTGIEVSDALAEVPTKNDGFAIVPVDDNGELGEAALGSEDLESSGRRIPQWGELVRAVCGAHAHGPLLNIHAIGWDVIPGATGPLILEGNSGWSLRPHQHISGPLLADPKRF